ncbi:SGF29 tudor-like domain-containing protein [Massariosphaeria phaeospora]|uniref:SGF29 tudor-like domain-containing protein n=1 Tax=Massariosphaeria phaeospora TaxID=100035 RepID=A0A7C8HYJ4_9PLEO|nr:SGF29 tudor-like domain-containing protein [Massariosphaeria phaeospora]
MYPSTAPPPNRVLHLCSFLEHLSFSFCLRGFIFNHLPSRNPSGQHPSTIKERETVHLHLPLKMAARSRPRAGHLKEEVDEERSIWDKVKADARRVDQLMSQSDDLQAKILQLTAEQTARINRGDSPSSRVDDQLEEAIRENIRVCNTASDLIKSDSQQDLSFNLTILTAIRTSDDAEPPASRSASVGKLQRDRQNKRRLTDTIDDRESITTDSPGGPSPKVVIPPPKDRLIAKSGGSRAGSVPAVRESSVKAEDDKDDPGKESSRHRLIVGTDVLYRNNKYRNSEGEGILCRVTSVIGEGKQRRYEIIDADPDPPTPAVPYRASVNHLVAIPPPATNLTLPDLPSKRNVLALYPGTTTFYKAEVVSAWRGAAGVKKEDGSEEAGSANYVRLRFEGEDEADREMSVERRYVLPDR